MAAQMVMLEYVTSKSLTRETCEIIKVCLLLAKFLVSQLSKLEVYKRHMFSLCYLFLYFLLFQNQRMDALWICDEQLGVWCNFTIPCLDFLPCPLISGEMGKLLKVWRCPYLASCRNQTAEHVKMEKYFFQKRYNCTTFRWNICKSPLTHFWGTVADMLGVPCGLALAVEYHAIASF